VSAWYTAARHGLLVGDFDFEVDTLAMIAVKPSYVFNADHTMATIEPHTGAGPIVMTVNAVTGTTVYVDPVTFPGVTDGLVISALVAYKDAAGVKTPVAFIDRRGDTVPINPLTGDGGSLTFAFDYLVRI
jgi:hypothetical protein